VSAQLAGEAAEILLRGVEKRFATPEGEVHALAPTDLSVRKGEMLVLLGPKPNHTTKRAPARPSARPGSRR